MDATPRHITLALTGLTTESWSAFGSLPGDERVGTGSDLEFLWNDGQVNFIAHDISELTFTQDGRACCDHVNRHDTHTQTLMPMTGDAYIVVAPERVNFSEPQDFETVRAFLVPQYVPVHLARGTWHWGPYPITTPSLRIFNVQGRGYARDNGITWLERDHHTTYEVAIND